MTNLEKIPMRTQRPDVRNKNFEEVELGYNDEEAVKEASRCLNCKNPRCVEGCPINIKIPEFISAIKDQDIEKAYNIISESSSLSAICGRVCPQEKQCEGKCIRGIKGDSIAIGALERYVSDKALLDNMQSKFIKEKNNKKVAIIGSGLDDPYDELSDYDNISSEEEQQMIQEQKDRISKTYDIVKDIRDKFEKSKL